MYFFRVPAEGSCTSSECLQRGHVLLQSACRGVMYFFTVCASGHVLLHSVCWCSCTALLRSTYPPGTHSEEVHVPPTHTLKKYMNPGTHSEEVHDPPAHTLKKYMDTGTHSEEVHEHRHTLFQSVWQGVVYFFRVCAGGSCTSSECVPVFMYFFRVCAGGSCTSSECVLKKYMNTGTHSEEVHEHRHTL
jgi:hypothetical protein